MDDILPFVYGVLAVGVGVMRSPRSRCLGGAGLVALGLGAAAEAVGGAGAPDSFTMVNRILAGTGIAAVFAALVLTHRGGDAGAVPRPAPVGRPGHPGLDVVLLAGLALASAAGHLIAIGVGVVLALAGAARGSVRSGRRAWLVPLIAGAGMIATGFFLTLTLLGPMGGRVMALPGGPFSPAAERLLALLLAGGALLVSGLFPLTRTPWRLAVAPLGAVLLVRVIGPGFPQGMAEWQPLALLVLTTMFAAAALSARWGAMGVSGGLATLWSGAPEAVLAGCVLVLWGWLADQAESVRAARGISLAPKWGRLSVIVPALAALPAFESVLRADVLLPVLGAVAAAGGFAWGARRRAGR